MEASRGATVQPPLGGIDPEECTYDSTATSSCGASPSSLASPSRGCASCSDRPSRECARAWPTLSRFPLQRALYRSLFRWSVSVMRGRTEQNHTPPTRGGVAAPEVVKNANSQADSHGYYPDRPHRRFLRMLQAGRRSLVPHGGDGRCDGG